MQLRQGVKGGRERTSYGPAAGHKVRSSAEKTQPAEVGQKPAQKEKVRRHVVTLAVQQALTTESPCSC